MARALLSVQSVLPGGMWPTLTPAVATGHMFPNSERGERGIFLLVRNDHTAPVTITIPSTFTRDGLVLANRTVSVPNATDRLIGPILAENHNQLAGADIGMTYIDYSLITAISVAVLRV